MKADIARVVILHRYGGMCVDMDVFPSCETFAQVPFAVQKVYTSGYEPMCPTTSAGKKQHKKHPLYDTSCNIDQEVMIASRNNPVLMRWLLFLQQEIQKHECRTRNNTLVSGARASRYILNTTGPQGLKRFLKTKDNAELRKTMQFIASCHFYGK